jgi:hypothetical protein
MPISSTRSVAAVAGRMLYQETYSRMWQSLKRRVCMRKHGQDVRYIRHVSSVDHSSETCTVSLPALGTQNQSPRVLTLFQRTFTDEEN